MGYELASTSQDGRDEDDDDEYEEVGGGNRLLGFMFGNVDGSGDLDVDYLDEDAKEHLGALADKLGPSLTDIDLSVKSRHAPADTAEQDYDEKAEDAVDYEDIDEQYEGPEIQATSEEDYLLPKKAYFSTQVSASTFEQKTSVFDDDNYDDDDEEFDKEHEMAETNAEVQNIPSSGKPGDTSVITSEGVKCTGDDLLTGSLKVETSPVDLTDFQEEDAEVLEQQLDESSTPLPILCIDDGAVILRFSEIFGNYEPLKKVEKKDRKYIVPKEKYKSIDTSLIVEEDEEEFLKGSSHVIGHQRSIQDDISGTVDDDIESAKFRFVEGPPLIASEVDDQRPDSCLSSLPMKEDMTLDLSPEWRSALSVKFYPLDQQSWEEKIIWDMSPANSDNAAESHETSAPDPEDLFSIQTALEDEPQISMSEMSVESGEKDHGLFMHSCPVQVEPFGSREFSDLADQLFPENRCHPQLLRLESRLEVPKGLDGRQTDVSEEIPQNDAIKRFNELTLQNRDIVEGSWVDRIIWEPHQSIAKPKLILDLQDEQMLFEILDNKDGKNLRLHAGAMLLTPSVNANAGDSLELHGHGGSSITRFNISNDKFYSSRKISQQLKSHSKKRAAQGVKVLHSIPALKLQTMKAKLSNKDIANFHRPRALWYPHDNEMALKELKEQGKLPSQGPMKIILKSLGGKGSKLHVDAEETISSVKAKASKKLDFKPLEPVKIFYSGRELEDKKTLAEQDVRPNSLLHLVRSKVHLLPRAQKVPGENKSLRPPGAFKKKSDLSVKDGHIFLMEYCEERPLLLGNVGMGARLCTYYQKSAPDDQMGNSLRSGNNSLGSVLVLDPTDKSPFLGDIKAGCRQSCLETNMYRAPMFPHKVSTTDYLLVRSAKGKLSLRRIDRLFVVGQQEPHLEVMSPGTKGVQTYIMNRLLVYMYREFRAEEKRGLIPSIRADELSAQFPSLSEAFLRKRLKHCADLQRSPNGQLFWVMRRNFRIPLEEELRRMVTPENVCAYESMQAGLYRLKRLGITRLTHPTGLSSAMNQLPYEAIALAAASHIERELQITPWNLSSNFVACTSQDRENIERLEITGVGDPSGRGLGFSYVRTAPKGPISNAMVKKKAAVARGGSTVTGTDADLRRLSMEAAREVLLKFNVPEEQIAKQTRWHRIAMIRKLSSEQAASGIKVDPTTISKYARGQRMSFLQLQQQTREKCQEIWDRQIQSLSAVDGDEFESDSEANSDLDSFAGDLENLLDAEECEEREEGNDDSKHDKLDGVRGLKMRRRPLQAQAEEEIEDEAAEAAELCRMLMDDDEAERKKKKKTRAAGEEMGLTPASRTSVGVKTAERVKKTGTMLKKDGGTVQLDESYPPKENVLRDIKKEEKIPAKKNLAGKVKAIKKNEIERMGLLNKKVKILGDGIKVVKEKKSAREIFVCGACGQLGHMRTNKNCPKYGEDLETQVEGTDDKASMRSKALDRVGQAQQKIMSKKLASKSATKTAVVEASKDEKSNMRAKVLKVKCGPTDKHPDKVTPAASQSSDRQITSDTEAVNKPVVKVNKIIFSNKMKSEDTQVESHRPSIVIKPPVEAERDQPRKKIIIKRPKEISNLEQCSQEGGADIECRKMKKIIELSTFEKHNEHDGRHMAEEASRKNVEKNTRLWEEEEKRRIAESEREERTRRLFEQRRLFEEQKRVAEIRKYEEAIRREREEEERQKAKKKKKKKRPETRDDYLDDFPPRRNDRKLSDRDRNVKRRPVVELGRYGAEYPPSAKRRRGGEVGLANILESVVEILKARVEVSYLFLKPVTKKEAPDYLDIIKRPMDLSTVREKVRRLEYKSRDEFRHDVWQIAFNAHKYNDGRNPGIPPLADQLLEICDYLLAENDTGLAEAEAGIENKE